MSWLNRLTPSQKIALLGAAGLLGGPLTVGAATGILLASSTLENNSEESSDGELDAAVVLNKEISQQMQRISKLTGLSEGEVLKNAIGLMEVVVLAAQKGHSLALLNSSGDVEANITGLAKDEEKL